MTARRAIEFINDGQKPHVLRDGRTVGSPTRSIRATYHLNAAGAALANGDTLFIGTRPKGSIYRGHRITTSVDLGAVALIALGITGTAAKYAAAAGYRTPNSPSGVALAARLADDPLAADEDMYATISVANLPTTDDWLVIETHFADENG